MQYLVGDNIIFIMIVELELIVVDLVCGVDFGLQDFELDLCIKLELLNQKYKLRFICKIYFIYKII